MAISIIIVLAIIDFSETNFSLTKDFKEVNVVNFDVSEKGDFMSYPLGNCKASNIESMESDPIENSRDRKLRPKTLPIQRTEDGVYYYNPVSISQYGLYSWRMWKCSGSKVHKEDFITSADWLVENIEINKNENSGREYGIWSYEFNFCLHGNCKKGEIMERPWVSGMTQGRAISVLSRAYKATKEKRYLKTAMLGMNAFLNVYDGKKKDKNWITYIDKEKKNIWIEEYPIQEIDNKKDVNFTLNGFNFALFGIYDYYFATKDNDALRLFQMGVKTLNDNLERYKGKNISYYCLRHRFKSKGYHNIHINQLKILGKITGLEFLKDYAREFRTLKVDN